MTDGSSAKEAVIKVTRPFQLFALTSIGWRVFIDGDWVGGVSRGKTTSFPVSPGHHTVKIWSHRGAQCSNELELDAVAGVPRLLECRKQPPPLGLDKLPQQLAAIRESVTVGVSTTILLSELSEG
jgi:hypothetical protein